MNANDRVIVALDFGSEAEAKALVAGPQLLVDALKEVEPELATEL